ncbi:hypothetical protein PSACC_01832 [Paramicrosporidium saccamoebae]|uniref:Uncharacterized protein n=1 Tax=Paramicrosporidium saccamoebae TaxID=1246581 RepID=A0A2H9TL17_9FUNG|nr:hypothetical protein PSACC_01832 [Paramicrosporidium saccamoebae]
MFHWQRGHSAAMHDPRNLALSLLLYNEALPIRITTQRDYWLLDDQIFDDQSLFQRSEPSVEKPMQELQLDEERQTLFLAPAPTPAPGTPVTVVPEKKCPEQTPCEGLFLRSELLSDNESQGWVIA